MSDDAPTVPRWDATEQWEPRRVVPSVSLRLLQRALGSVFFASTLSRLGMVVASKAALGYARQFKSATVRKVDGLTVVSGLPTRAYPRGGLCVGSVFLTGPEPTSSVLRHEGQHAKQWRTYGLAMPLLYWLAGRDAKRNWFEVDAGLEDGGYV